jgi:hypothetical protein
VIRRFENYFSANIILSKLRDQEIRCYLLDENTVTIMPVFGTAIGWIRLVVDKKDEAVARAALQQFDVEYLLSVQCPKCLANDIILVQKPGTKNFITAIFTWLFSSYAVAPEQVYQCQQCGYETESLPENVSLYN